MSEGIEYHMHRHSISIETTIEEVNVGISSKSHLFACNSPIIDVYTRMEERENPLLLVNILTSISSSSSSCY